MDKVIVSGKIVLGTHLSQVQICCRGWLMEPKHGEEALNAEIITVCLSYGRKKRLMIFSLFFTSLPVFIMAELTLSPLFCRWQWFASWRHQTTIHYLCLWLLFLTCEFICELHAEQMQWRERSFKPQLWSCCVAHITAYFGRGLQWEQL